MSRDPSLVINTQLARAVNALQILGIWGVLPTFPFLPLFPPLLLFFSFPYPSLFNPAGRSASASEATQTLFG